MCYKNDTHFGQAGQDNSSPPSVNDKTSAKGSNESLPFLDETTETAPNSLIFIPPEYASESIDQQAAWEQLVAHLHCGGGWGYYWTASLKRYPDDHPNPRLRKQSYERLTFWFAAGECPPPPPEDGPHGLRQIYFGVNPTIMRRGNPQIGQRATLDSISVVNALIGEIDLKDYDGDWTKLFAAIDNLLLPPSVMIISGGGGHLYWLFGASYVLDDGAGKQDPSRKSYIRSIQHRWVEGQPALDQGAKDLTRLLRPVGTTNYKPKYAPNYPQVRFIKADFSLLYSLEEIENLLPAIGPKPSKSTPKKRPRPKSASALLPNKSNWRPPEGESRPRPANDVQKAKFYIRYFDPSCGRREWFEIGCILSGLGDAGLAIWDEWSSQSHKYVPGEPHELWPNMSPDGALGLGTLVFRAINSRGAPRFLRRNERSDEEFKEDWSRVEERSNSRNQSSERVDVGDVNASLTEIFCPERSTYFWINLPDADTVIQLATKHDGPLLGVLRKALNRDKRQIRINGKRKRTVMSILSNPIDANGMTRLWPLVCHSDDVSGLMGTLAELGLSSCAYQIPSFLPSSTALPKVDTFGQFPIPYIYRADTLSTKINLGKMGKGAKVSTFESLGLESASMIVVMFAQLEPVGLVQAIAAALSTTPITTHSELWYPLSVIPGMADPTSPKAYYPIIHNGEEVSMRRVYKGLEKILSDYRFVGHHDLVEAWCKLASLNVENERGRPDKVGESLESAIRHFNREHDLSDLLGVDVSQKVVACPWCGGQMVIWPAIGQGHHAAYCECQPNQVITPFWARCKRDGLSQEQLVDELRSNPETHYGRAGGFSVEFSGHPAEEEEPTWHEEAPLRLEAHLADIEGKREKRREEIKALKPGVIHIYRDSPGFGKSYVFQVHLVPEWKEEKKKIVVTTETRAQSEDWQRLCDICNAKVYLPVTEVCDCYPSGLLAEAINKNYSIKHKPGCAYLGQRKELEEGHVVFIMRHDHLIVNLFAQTDVFVHDESIVNKLLRNYRADLMDDVLRLLNVIQNDQNDQGSSNKDRQNLRLATVLLDALLHVARESKLKPYMHLRADQLIERLRAYLKSHDDYQDVTLEDAIRGAKESKYGKRPTLLSDRQKGQLHHSWLPTFIEALEKTLANPVHPTVWLVQESQSLAKRAGGKAANKLAYHWYIKHQYMPKIPKINNKANKARHFILDASANPDIYQALLPEWEIVMHGEQIPLSPMCQVFQIVGINTTKKELRRNLVGVAKKIAHIANEQELLIDAIGTHKEFKKALAELFDVPEHMSLHYRNQRGSNSYEPANCLLGLGDSNVPASVVERVSHALHSDSSEPFDRYKNGQIVRVVRGGRATGKDKRVQAVARMMQEEEAHQFVQRLRGILAEKEKIVLYVGKYDFSQFGIKTIVIDASQLKGQSKVVQNALDLYHARKSNGWRS